MSTTEFHLYDQNCDLCNPQNRDYQHEFCFTYKSIVFIVHLCRHCVKHWSTASHIVGELYDEIDTRADWRYTDLAPAMHYGLYHRGYWNHECDEYYNCRDCGCRYSHNRIEMRKDGNLLFECGTVQFIFKKDSGWISDFLDKRFCDACYKVRVSRLLELNEREKRLWLERIMLEKRELSQLKKLQGLFSEAKKALRQNKGQEVLQLLKEEFEQAASLPE